MPRALLLYYSLTGQASRAVEAAARACRDAGWDPAVCRIDFADAAQRPSRPFTLADTRHWVAAATDGAVMDMTYEPAGALEGEYDLVLLFTNTWNKHPSVPVNSFLKGPAARSVLSGRPFAVYAICRRLYEQNLAIVTEDGERAGGRCIGRRGFVHWGGQIGSLIQTMTYIHRSDTGRTSFLGIPLPAYGLSDSAMEGVQAFTKEVLAKAA